MGHLNQKELSVALDLFARDRWPSLISSSKVHPRTCQTIIVRKLRFVRHDKLASRDLALQTNLWLLGSELRTHPRCFVGDAYGWVDAL